MDEGSEREARTLCRVRQGLGSQPLNLAFFFNFIFILFYGPHVRGQMWDLEALS